MRKMMFVLLFALLLIPAVVQPQDKQEMTCEDYLNHLEAELSTLYIRLESLARTPASLRSDYAAFQEKRVGWQEISPPDCTTALHADVIAMYANLGDIYAWGLYLEYDPESNSGNRIVQESIDRARLSISTVADAVAEISGNDLDLSDVWNSLEAISDRFNE